MDEDANDNEGNLKERVATYLNNEDSATVNSIQNKQDQEKIRRN